MWKEIQPDEKGRARWEWACKCGNAQFQIVKEPEKSKKHPGQRGKRIAAVCTYCDDKKPHRVGWPDSSARRGIHARRSAKA